MGGHLASAGPGREREDGAKPGGDAHTAGVYLLSVRDRSHDGATATSEQSAWSGFVVFLPGVPSGNPASEPIYMLAAELK